MFLMRKRSDHMFLSKILSKYTCIHDYRIINESHRNEFLGPIDGWIKLDQRYELYCIKCKRRIWVDELTKTSLMNISKLENKNEEESYNDYDIHISRDVSSTH